jgi:hypothetical protein
MKNFLFPMLFSRLKGNHLQPLFMFGFLYLFLNNHHAVTQNPPIGKSDQGKLAEILDKTSGYCSRLEKAALDFVCIEVISERIDPYLDNLQFRLASPWNVGARLRIDRIVNPITTNTYKYDYQLVRKDDEIKESRTLIEENCIKKDEKASYSKTSAFMFDKPIFGPIAVLSKERQNYYDYELLEDVELSGNRVFLLEAKPKPTYPQRIVFGRVWIRKGDYCILKIEWHQTSIANFLGHRGESPKIQSRA